VLDRLLVAPLWVQLATIVVVWFVLAVLMVMFVAGGTRKPVPRPSRQELEQRARERERRYRAERLKKVRDGEDQDHDDRGDRSA